MIKNEVLFRLMSDLIPKVLPLVKPAIKAAYFPTNIDNYPVLKYNEAGMPTISTYPSIIDISSFFRSYGSSEPRINLKSFPEYELALLNVFETPEIISYYGFPNRNDIDQERRNEMLRVRCQGIVEDFIEHYYYLHGETYEEQKFQDIYIPLENFIYCNEVHFDISIPILFIKFDADYFEIAPNIAIRRISDEVHRSRYRVVGFSPAIVSSVFMSATHELVLKDYTYQRPSSWLDSPFSQPQIYPHEMVEKFFTTLKIATDHTSGYAQVLVHPHNWTEYYSADLIPLTGASLKAYPTYFDDFYWNKREYPVVSSTELELLASLFNKTINTKENKLSFALKRFYKSTLRQEEEDIIIDLIIAFEILLGDKEKGEITHKLALRVAALLSRYCPDSYDPVVVFGNVKKIYEYRSSIVHGSHQISKKREIKLQENVTVPTVNLAKDYLREVLKIIINEPKHLDSSENDKLLLQRDAND